MRITRSRLGLSMVQSSTNSCLYPPEISLPMTTPPWPFFMWQRRTMMFSLGTFHFRPSLLRPDLMAMQSSPVSKKQSSINTLRQDSGSQPSPLGPSLMMVTPLTTMFSLNRGWMTQKAEFNNVTPSIRIRFERTILMSCGLSASSWPMMRLSRDNPSSAARSKRLRPLTFCPGMPGFHPNRAEPHRLHHVSLLPWPSMIPLPVMAMLVSP